MVLLELTQLLVGLLLLFIGELHMFLLLVLKISDDLIKVFNDELIIIHFRLAE